MKPRTEHHPSRPKLPPLLEIDEDGDSGLPGTQAWSRPRWSSDGEEPGVSLDEWPAEYDD